MISANGWLDWALPKPGPPEKQYSQANAVAGFIPHSMVGSLNGWYSRLMDLSKLPDGSFTPNAAASVHGSVLLDGTVIQHYPLTASCWASGSRAANTRFVAFEHESIYTDGRPDETKPLTPQQVDADVRIIRELMVWKGWQPRRPKNASDLTATLYEHNEMTRFGALATSCPSGRVPWAAILEKLQSQPVDEEEMMLAPTWATWKDRPSATTYRTYLLFTCTSAPTLRKVMVENADQEQALQEAGIIGKTPKPMPLAQLKQFAGGPEPDAH